MARKTTIKHLSKTGPFTAGELMAGEIGLDAVTGTLYSSRDGQTVQEHALADHTHSEFEVEDVDLVAEYNAAKAGG